MTGLRGTPERLDAFISAMPKVELHLHLEGTLEPEMLLRLAERNRVEVGFADVHALRAAYRFSDLRSFLDLYYRGTEVLVTEQDFFELTLTYLERADAMAIRHAEVFFDPQSHTRRGVPFGAVLEGVRAALDEGERRLGVTSRLIMCFLRDLGPEAAAATFAEAGPYLDVIDGIGLDSAEVGYPPALFQETFEAARANGLHAVAHAGEEGPPAYIEQALDLLKVERIDHGVRCLEDPRLVGRLARDRIPLTVCPLSNVRLGVVPSLEQHALRRMLAAGLCVTVNSDDPAYFGGYLTENFLAVRRALDLSFNDIRTLAADSYSAAFIDESRRRRLLAEFDEAASGYTLDHP